MKDDSSLSVVKIERLDGLRTNVWIDGKEAKGVKSYTMKHTAGGLPAIILEMLVGVGSTIDQKCIYEYYYDTEHMTTEEKRCLLEQLESELLIEEET